LKNIITGEDVDIAFESGKKEFISILKFYHKYSKGKKGKARDTFCYFRKYSLTSGLLSNIGTCCSNSFFLSNTSF